MADDNPAGIDSLDDPPPAAPSLLSTRSRSFKGKDLAPYSFARRLIARTVGDRSDPTADIWALSVVFSLTLSEKEARVLMFNAEAYRDALFKWTETLEKPDLKTARSLAEEILTEAASSEVEQDTPPDPLKKN